MAERPLSILHLTQGYWPMLGGGELLSTRLSEGLARRGHRVHVVNAPPSHITWVRRPDGFPEPAGRDGVVLESPPGWARWDAWDERLTRWPIPGRGELRQGLRALRRRALARHLVARATAMPADLLLVSSANRLLMGTAQQVLGRLDVPLLAVTQAHLEDPRLPWDQAGPFWQRADALAVNTRHEGQALGARLSLSEEACVVTGCGTEPATIPAPWPREERVLCLGRIDPNKGIDLLLDAMRRVWSCRPQARLTVAGSRNAGSPQVDAWLAALPADLRARVEVRADVTDAEKQALLATTRVLVLPSRHESFGIVLLEAWAHATPVVTLDTSVARCIVTEGVNGLLCAPGEATALAAALESLLEDGTRARRLGEVGRATFLAEHTWDHVAERYEQAARRAVERHTRARKMSSINTT